MGSWGDEGGGCSRGVCVRTPAGQSCRLRGAAGRWGGKGPRARLEGGECRARSQRQPQPRRGRGSKGRAPARELEAGGAPSDPQGAGCRDAGPRRGRGGASSSLSGRGSGLGSLTLPGAPCLSGVEQPATRGTTAIRFREGGGGDPHPPFFSWKCWVTSPSIARGADTLRNSTSLNLDYKRQDRVCPNASTSNLRGLGGAETRGDLERSEALLCDVSARGAGAISGGDRPPFALLLAENRTLNCFVVDQSDERWGEWDASPQ